MSTFEQPWEKLFDPRDVLAKLLIEKDLITEAEFMQKLSAERARYQEMLGKVGAPNHLTPPPRRVISANLNHQIKASPHH